MARRPTSSRKTAARRTEAAPVQRADLYQRITDTIIAQLEEGRVPWVQPWTSLPGTAAVSMPRNAATNRAYSGINVMLLWGSGMAAGYPVQRWLTFRQALSLGGCVRRGEKGTPVVYADRLTPEQERQRASQAGEEARSIAFLKQYTVFNAAQCDGLSEDLYVPPPPPREDLIEPRFRALMQATGLTIHIGGQIAFYRPADDAIVLPPPQAFHEPVNFHRTAAHEMIHATGHASRLARDFTGRYGSEGYAREELVAEISAAYVCASLGIVPTVRHADYIGSWLEVLRSDPRAIVQAAGLASRSADWLLGHLPAELAPDGGAGSETDEAGVEAGDDQAAPAALRAAA
ncbi:MULTISPECIES: ArdC family protein [Methylobacterium]|jgi:antirestriction protein ArdC|uniref:Antirepressor n=1 Tax=Methylobacterium aquaticum TaxID=270351 RepID=A0A0J6SMD6_9HYPH|nr:MULTISPECIES: zincin-like metallopeptidase domain-containing protein [Methylobacterium]KMO34834.1 antirepressor [Methylobacterium aquaticum]MBY0258181.1 ssDNA-binding domain-containing protein [Methylobacterium sp.]